MAVLECPDDCAPFFDVRLLHRRLHGAAGAVALRSAARFSRRTSYECTQSSRRSWMATFPFAGVREARRGGAGGEARRPAARTGAGRASASAGQGAPEPA